MIEDIIDIHTRYAHINARERHTLEQVLVDARAELDIADLIVAARTAVEPVDAYLRGIDAEIKLLTRTLVEVEDIEVLDIEGIASEEPSPAEIRTYARLSLR